MMSVAFTGSLTRPLRPVRPLVGLLVVSLLAGLAVAIPAAPAGAAPLFKLPFRCGEVWHAGTYAGHSPDVDWNAYPSDYGRPVLASASGTVRVGMARLGEMWIDHGGGWSTRYLHMENRRTDLDGKHVAVGTQIGTVAAVGGGAFSPHLHYEQRFGDVEQPVAIDGVRISVGGTNPGAPAYTSTNCANHPVGRLEAVTSAADGKVRIRGWAFDRDAPTAPLVVRAYIGGPHGTPGVQVTSLGEADGNRPDVAAAYPSAGPGHGFDATISTSKRGSQSVCVYAMNVGAGSNTLLGCKTVTVKGDVTLTVGYSESDHQLLVRAAQHTGKTVDQFTRDATIILAYLVYISDPADARAIRPVPATTGPKPVTVTWSSQEIGGVDGIGRFFALDRLQSQRVSANLFAFLALLDGA
jgi:hypothetical protein